MKLLPLEKKVIFTQQDKLWNGGKTKEIPLSKDQRQMGGEHYTNDRLNRAANGDDGYTVMAKVLNKQKWH
ncbi:hypothetical protein PORCAN_1949 [Porphyromonas crevioricanis JCM 13913]|nr:hypothetical protein PORCAN_1949 [Porphyromonas crevioricanis JCM 13913]